MRLDERYFPGFWELGFPKSWFSCEKKHVMSVFKRGFLHFSTDISLQIAEI